MRYESVSESDLGKGSRIALDIVEGEIDLYWAMALDMVERIRSCEAEDGPCVFIVPVGPVGQYRRFAELCNRWRLDLRAVHFVNMDEYLDEDGRFIPYDHPLSFRSFMDRECYSRLDPKLAMPPENRIFPEPGREGEIAERIAALGGIDTTYGGIGINGHVAFNEPPESDMGVEEFSSLPTRVLDLSRETRTINSVTAAGGYIDYIPRRCITVGMREILSARRVRLYLNREWQKGVVRLVLHGPVTPRVPASLLALHPDAKLTITAEVAKPPAGRLR
jgi:glucosamine-6-phosphate deaminase